MRKEMCGDWRYISTIHDLRTTWRRVVSLTLLPRYSPPENVPKYPLKRGLGSPTDRETSYIAEGGMWAIQHGDMQTDLS
jgi:hypothetical protein